MAPFHFMRAVKPSKRQVPDAEGEGEESRNQADDSTSYISALQAVANSTEPITTLANLP